MPILRFVHQARMLTMDGLLCFWVTCSLSLGKQAIQPGRLGRCWWLLSAIACGLGLLTKGPIALALAAGPLLAYQVIEWRRARPSIRWWLIYLGTAAGVAAPWYLAMA